MITIQVSNKKQSQQFEHAAGPLEFGRGPKRKAERFVINDLFVSRDQIRIQEQANGSILVENLSTKQEVLLPEGANIPVGARKEVPLPVRLILGQTFVDVTPVSAETPDHPSLAPVSQPAISSDQATAILKPLIELGEAPAPESLAHWLETVIRLQRSATSLSEFYAHTARALVELIGLDEGLVLLRRDFNWEVAGRHTTDPNSKPSFSRTLLSHVAAEARTFYQDTKKLTVQPESLRGIEIVVVSPILGAKEEVIGALYGVRNRDLPSKGGIRPLEAQVIQLLAANIGANISRMQFNRTQAQFELFFPAAVGQQLHR